MREDVSPQALIDALSVSLARAVLLDSRLLTPLVFSRQWDVDAVRSESILGRGAPDAAREALFAQGIADADDVLHTAPDPALGMEDRVCMPVRDGAEVLGYIWVLDPESDLGPADLDRIRATATALVPFLSEGASESGADRSELVESLCSPSAPVREEAARRAQDSELLTGALLALCLLGEQADGSDPFLAANRVARRLSMGGAIAGRTATGAVLIVSLDDRVLRGLAPQEVGAWIETGSGGGVAAGLSGPAAPTALHEARREAAIALRIGKARGLAGQPAVWSQLGADCLIAQLPETVRGDVPEALSGVLRDEPTLRETLSTFLDAAGDIQRVAAALSLHRSGVYYRLRRIEQAAGLDLSRGEDRLLAHIAIRSEALLQVPHR